MEVQAAAVVKKKDTRRVAGGAATGGGMNFQAAVTAICYVRMARGSALGWLDGLTQDIPIAVSAETDGPGDDVRVDLTDGKVIEIQVKRGLKKGNDLWRAMTSLAQGLTDGTIAFGVLAVCPNSSQTLRRELARDIRRLGDGLTDGMSAIGRELVTKLESAGLEPHTICSRLRLVTVSALAGADAATIDANKAELGHLCAQQNQIERAWLALEADAHALIERRGRRDLTAILQCLRARQITLTNDYRAGPAVLLERLNHWNFEAQATFSLIGTNARLDIDRHWIPLTALVRGNETKPDTNGDNLSDALKAYHDWERLPQDRNTQSVNPETLGRFVKRGVIVAGPGLGKSTLLKRIVRRYSEDGIPVLRVRLASVAASMRGGMPFEDAVFRHGLDGSGLSVDEIKRAGWRNWLLLGDGLDECGDLQHEVAGGVERFALGYPTSRILVTTRPVGYRAAHFAEWRHYDLAPLDPSYAARHLAALLEALSNDDQQSNFDEVAADQLKNREIREIIGRTPLILGMAAAVLASGRDLGSTREEVFEQIFALIDDIPRRSLSKPVGDAVLNRMLDILAWHLTARPLLPCPEMERLCAADLAVERGDPVLKAADLTHSILAYWEDAGLIERVGSGIVQVYGFIHKSLGEFAAARRLCELPEAKQLEALQQCMTESAWNEVLRFAGLRGPADQVAAQIAYLPVRSPDIADKLAYGARLLAEVPERITVVTRKSLLDRIFELVAENHEPKTAPLGISLIAIAKLFPDDVAPLAAGVRHSPHVWATLVAWNCLVAAGPQFYEIDDLVASIEPAISAGALGMETSLAGGMMLRVGESGKLSAELAIAAALDIAARCERKAADAVIGRIFNLLPRHDFDFVTRAEALIDQEGWNVTIEREAINFKGFDLGGDWDRAQMCGDRFILGALAGDEIEEAEFDEFKHLLNLSAFVQMSKMSEVAASDVWAWTRTFDPAPATHVIEVFATVSGIDFAQLRSEAARAKYILEASAEKPENERWPFRLLHLLKTVDPPTPEWKAARERNADFAMIEAATYHPSQWIVWIAANLLESGLDGLELEACVERLYRDGQGLTLWAAAGIANELPAATAISLTLAQLSRPLRRGSQYMFAQLSKWRAPLTPEMMNVLEAGLFAGEVQIGCAASDLVAHFAEQSSDDFAAMGGKTLIDRAWHHWLKHEEPYPQSGGAIPDSPRAALTRALISLGGDGDVIDRARSDSRSDVRGIAKARFQELALATPEALDAFLTDIESAKAAPQDLAAILRQKPELTSMHVKRIEGFLSMPSDSLRFNAMGILDKRYLSGEAIRAHANRLHLDSNRQVSERAAGLRR